MIKFFRKIRQKLLIENRFDKYLIYAIGEIILVVIGILIALYINNSNEQRKTEAKVDLVFEEMMDELASNITAVKRNSVFFEYKDSLTYLVLNTDISKEDYKIHAAAFRSVTSNSKFIDLSNDAYNKLMLISEDVPEKYKHLMEDLQKLNHSKLYIDKLDNMFNEAVYEINKYNTYNYTWAIKFNLDELADYLYSDPKYKSDVSHVANLGYGEQYEKAILYMVEAIRSYKKIAALLNKPIDNELLGNTSPFKESLIGDWVAEQISGAKAKIYKDSKQLSVKINSSPVISTIYFLTDTKIVLSPGGTILSILEEDGIISLHSNQMGVWKRKTGN